jgi:hypothetical protein
MVRGHKNAYTDLTADFVRNRFWYEPWTGQLSYRIPPNSCYKQGDPVGTKTLKGYIRVVIDWKHYLSHRIIWLWMTGEWPEFEIDHIDGNKANNKWSNLRKAQSFQNMHYKGVQINNTSGFKGVWKSSAHRWCAEIKIRGIKHIVGHYDTPEEASKARNAFAKKALGKFYFKEQ